MPKTFFLGVVLCCSSIIFAPEATPLAHPTAAPQAITLPQILTMLTGTQLSDWNSKNIQTIVAPIATLHALEHLVFGNKEVGKQIAGSKGNRHHTRGIALFMILQLAHHIVPNILIDKKQGIIAGLKSFAGSTHLTGSLYRMSLFRRGFIEKCILKCSALCLTLYQLKTTNTLLKNIALECTQQGIQNPFVIAQTEPSTAHIKLPHYPIQSLRNIVSQTFQGKLQRDRFNKRKGDDTLPKDKTVDESLHADLVNKTIFSVGLGTGLQQALGPIVTNAATLLEQLSFIKTSLSKNIDAHMQDPTHLLFACNANTAFLAPETFEKLSPALQQQITAATQSELIINAHTLLSPSSDKGFRQALKAHQET